LAKSYSALQTVQHMRKYLCCLDMCRGDGYRALGLTLRRNTASIRKGLILRIGIVLYRPTLIFHVSDNKQTNMESKLVLFADIP